MTTTDTTMKERQQQTWAAGSYEKVGNPLVIMGELLCEAVDVRAGQKVLDVATGSGNTAISAARRSCRATGVDLVPALIDEARARAKAERMEITFDVGDAEHLPYGDDSFDIVLSTVGVMFAQDQEQTARELLRVCRPGGKIGLVNWAPDGFIGHLFRTVGGHVPPPPGARPPFRWGTEDGLRELLGDGISSLQATRRQYVFRHLSAEHFVDSFRSFYGPLHRAFGTLDAAGQQALASDLTSLLNQWNTSGDNTLVIPSDYLEAVAITKD